MATATYAIPNLPFFLQRKQGDGDPIVYSAADFRRMTTALSRRTGILGAGDFVVDQALNVSWTILVNSGYANVGPGGHYICILPADIEIPLTGFTTNPSSKRTHKVWVAVQDALTQGVGYSAQIVVTEDTGTGAPDPPDAAAWLQLATFTISPGQSNIQRSHITNTAQHGGALSDRMDLGPYLNPGYESANNATSGAAVDTENFSARYQDGGIMRLGGGIRRASGAAFPADDAYVIGIMYIRFRPKKTRFLTCPCSISEPRTNGPGTYTCRLRIDPDGTMTVQMPANQTPQFIFFDGVTYDLD